MAKLGGYTEQRSLAGLKQQPFHMQLYWALNWPILKNARTKKGLNNKQLLIFRKMKSVTRWFCTLFCALSSFLLHCHIFWIPSQNSKVSTKTHSSTSRTTRKYCETVALIWILPRQNWLKSLNHANFINVDVKGQFHLFWSVSLSMTKKHISIDGIVKITI